MTAHFGSGEAVFIHWQGLINLVKENNLSPTYFYYLLFSNGDINLSLVFIHSIFQVLLFDLAYVIMEICNNNKVFIGKWAISHFNINYECLELIFMARFMLLPRYLRVNVSSLAMPSFSIFLC